MPTNSAVDAWFARYDNPMKDVVLRVREIVLGADPRIEECIKWQAPTFTFEGNLASFFPKSKQHASLMFHVGARIPGKHPRLEGTSGTGRVMKIRSVAEADGARRDIEAVVRAWCVWRASERAGARVPADKPPAKEPPAKRRLARKLARKSAPKLARKSAPKSAPKSARKPAPNPAPVA